MIPHMLVCGSDQRCPRDVWDHALHKYTRKEQGSIIDELLKGAAQGKSKGAGAEPKTSALEEAMPEGFCRTTRGNLQAFRPSPSPSPSPSPNLSPNPGPNPSPNPDQPAGLPRAVRRLRAPGDDRARGRRRDGHQGLQRLRLQAARDPAHLQVAALPRPRLHAWPRELRDLPLARDGVQHRGVPHGPPQRRPNPRPSPDSNSSPSPNPTPTPLPNPAQ
eukprot:scaffold86681_cov72-Phaeocystis_antarctica.AAC.1